MFISDHNNINASNISDANLITVERCGMCGGTRFRKLIKLYDIPEVNYIECKDCGAVTFDRILSQDAIARIYASDDQYYKDSRNGESGGNITFYGSKRFAKHLLKYYSSSSQNEYRILDFGGGDGELAYAVARELYRSNRYKQSEIMVVDYTSKLFNTHNRKVKMQHAFGLDELFAEEEQPYKKYDIIIASGVMEHIPEPGSDIVKLFELLAPGGIIYFRTPYIYPLRRDLSRIGIEYDSLYPAHIWDLGGKWWDDLPQKVGYKGNISIINSRPSIVEKSFSSHFVIALASYVLKAPWFICHLWPYVGGWEAVYKKNLL